jgi:hypothetical protein
MSGTESERDSPVESVVSSSDSGNSSPAVPDTPPPSRSNSDVSSDNSPSASFTETTTTTNEYDVTSNLQLSRSFHSQHPTTSSESSESELSDPDEQCPYAKDLQWRHLDQVPDEPQSTQVETVTSSSNDVTSSTEENGSDEEVSKVSDNEVEDEDNTEDEDEEDCECNSECDCDQEEDEEECDADDEESDSDVSQTYYVYVSPNRSSNDFPPLLTFLLFLFIFLHLVDYVLLLQDSRNNACFPFRH